MIDAKDSVVQEIVRRGADPARFNTEQDEGGEDWIFRFLPSQPRARGGGFEVRIHKATGDVSRVLRYQ